MRITDSQVQTDKDAERSAPYDAKTSLVSARKAGNSADPVIRNSTDWEKVLSIIEALRATGHTGNFAVRIRMQNGGIRHAKVVNEQEVMIAEMIKIEE